MPFMGTIQDTTKALMVTMWMVCLQLMELLVHISTSGHLVVACLQVVVAVPLWAMTTFVRVLQHAIIGRPDITSLPNATLWDG